MCEGLVPGVWGWCGDGVWRPSWFGVVGLVVAKVNEEKRRKGGTTTATRTTFQNIAAHADPKVLI